MTTLEGKTLLGAGKVHDIFRVYLGYYSCRVCGATDKRSKLRKIPCKTK